ncbi:23S rRNA (cytosine1962-C5)-methyltransferase [Cohaesibacter sp. ES.047]|nr:23S rRNA (cytosine1962-C5)-methyltransferase [Cohaesibacter sp. ES.047]
MANRRGGKPTRNPGQRNDRQGGDPGGRNRAPARGPQRDKPSGAKSGAGKSGAPKPTFTPGRVIKKGNRDEARPKSQAETREPFILPPRPEGPVPRRAPFSLMVTEAWDDYALLDMGHSEKLERYGPYTIVRPETQAMGSPHLAKSVWDKADAIFSGDLEEEGPGRWRYPDPLGETWETHWDGIRFYGRFTAFRHVGFFPEQAAHWQWMDKQLRSAFLARPPRVLNLFGYSGVASLVAARAGAEVTHVDASKKAVAYGKENQMLAGLDDKPIRWIVDDAMKFVQREIRRGNVYDGILLDPPKFGRGPKGEVWQLFEMLPEMLDACRQILSKEALFFTLTSYAMRASYAAFDELMIEVMTGKGGIVESGELMIAEENGQRTLNTSLYTRWRPLSKDELNAEQESEG